MSTVSRISPQQVEVKLNSSNRFGSKTESSHNEPRSLFETILRNDDHDAVAANILDRVNDPNDLVALVRCSSTLHERVIQRIYHHFNIIWDTTAKAADKCALALGVCTLAKFQHNRRANPKSWGGTRATNAPNRRDGRRWRNTYATYVRKFSIANGPEDIAEKYLTTNICGLQLNALIATAVAHMHYLECFAWDLPTGISVEIWNALSSMADPSSGSPAPLEKVWVRLPHSPSLEQACLVQSNTTHDRSFSLVGPLKSLSVLDIDGTCCLDEIAFSIQKSWGVLRELRVGMSPNARQNLTHDALELLFSGVWQMHSQQRKTSFDKRHLRRERSIRLSGVVRAPEALHLLKDEEDKQRSRSVSCVQTMKPKHPCWNGEVRQVLRLETLELERMRISARVLRRVVDWTTLGRLTLLSCTSTERLWKSLCPSVASASQFCPRFNLKAIHVDELSFSLVRFLTGTLKRNTLEAFFLQGRSQDPVGIGEGNVEGALWNHRLSLRKIVIERAFSIKELELFNRRNMPVLRELGVDLVHRDWVIVEFSASQVFR